MCDKSMPNASRCGPSASCTSYLAQVNCMSSQGMHAPLQQLPNPTQASCACMHAAAAAAGEMAPTGTSKKPAFQTASAVELHCKFITQVLIESTSFPNPCTPYVHPRADPSQRPSTVTLEFSEYRSPSLYKQLGPKEYDPQSVNPLKPEDT